MKCNNYLVVWREMVLPASLFVLILFLWSCHSNDHSSINKITQLDTKTKAALQLIPPPEECATVKSYITEPLFDRYTPIHPYYSCGSYNYPYPVPAAGGGGGIATDLAGAAPETSVNNSTPDTVSGTNNQEIGVDEGDTVKTDENGNLYLLSGSHFIIAKGFPAEEMNVLSTIDLGLRGIYLHLDEANNKAIIIARKETPYYIANQTTGGGTIAAVDSLIWPGPVLNSQTYILVYAIDPTQLDNPQLIDQTRVDGRFIDSRRVDDRLHIVTSHHLNTRDLERDQEFTDLVSEFRTVERNIRCADVNTPILDPEIVAKNPLIIQAKQNIYEKIIHYYAQVDGNRFLPKAYKDEQNSINTTEVNYLQCQDIRFPRTALDNNSLMVNPYRMQNLKVLTSLNTDGSNMGSTAIVNNAAQVYVSKDNLYLSEVIYGNWWNTLRNPMTSIYKFSISSNNPQYVAMGAVEGFAKNQFNFSEHNNALRVATHQRRTLISGENGDIGGGAGASPPIWRTQSTNHLTILKDDGNGSLYISGEVRDFMFDEDIYSARFLGDRGYVVTFRRTDPLFAFNLSDPTNPILEGELEIPGFSTYMHPLDENHLLTIGRTSSVDQDNFGRIIMDKLQLQIFDVSNIKQPVQLHKHTPQSSSGWTWSAALYDHKSFTFSEGMLAIPLQYYGNSTTDSFNGMAAFSVSTVDGISELGRVDHTDLAEEIYCPRTLGGTIIYPCPTQYAYWASPRSSVIMTQNNDAFLYTISDLGVKATNMANFSTALNKILFPPQTYPWWYTVLATDAVSTVGSANVIAQDFTGR